LILVPDAFGQGVRLLGIDAAELVLDVEAQIFAVVEQFLALDDQITG